jgi:hypothetical protein
MRKSHDFRYDMLLSAFVAANVRLPIGDTHTPTFQGMSHDILYGTTLSAIVAANVSLPTTMRVFIHDDEDCTTRAPRCQVK